MHVLEDLLRGWIRHVQHFMAREDTGKDLALPLVCDGVLHLDLQDHVLDFLGGSGILEGLVEALSPVPIVALGHLYDDAVLVAARLCGGHALDGLVDVLVQWISAVGGDHDVRVHTVHRGEILHELAAGLVSLGRISRKGGDHLLVRVNRDVQYEGKLCLLGSKQHVLVDQIAIQDAGPRLVGRNEGRAMVRKDRLLGCDARKDGLPAAGKARKEMGLDEALGNQKVSLYGKLVDQEASARGKGAEVNHVLVLLGLVNHELLVLDQVLAELVDHLFLGRGPVEPGGNQDRNVTVGIIFPNFLQIKGKGDLAGDGPRVI